MAISALLKIKGGFFMKNKYEKFYKEVPKNYIEKLNSFRISHQEKKLRVNGVEWRYISSGSGKEVIVLLAGGMGVGEVFFSHIIDLEKSFKVIVPSFPEVSTIKELVDGINNIMQKEGRYQFNILGQSFGGILAQEMIRNNPRNIKKVILSHTTTSSNAINESIMDEYINKIRKLIKLVKLLPMCILKSLFKKKICRLLSTIKLEERKFWESYFAELIYSKTKKQEISIYECMVDFAQNYIYSKEDFEKWKGKMLILEADTDDSFEKVQKSAVRELFNEAQSYEFKGTGHLSIIAAREEYIKIVKDFLKIA